MYNRVLVLTAIKPDPLNSGGGPSALIWEIINTLKEKNIEIDIRIEKEKNSKVVKLLHRYGIYLKKIKKNFDFYEKIIVYPDNLVFAIPKKYRSKIIVIGPDSPSLRDARQYKEIKKNKFSILNFFMKKVYYSISKYHEYRILKQTKLFLVVGKTDKLWMEKNLYVKNKPFLKEKIKFLRHPVLSKVIKEKLEIKNVREKRFIFSGDLNYKFNNRFIINIARKLSKYNNFLKEKSLNIVVVGKNNKWIADLFKNIEICDVIYIEWIEDYNDVCVIGQDVHCLPLLVGAGTKNRALTAISNGLEIITTSIGIENIMYKSLTSVYITNSARCFVQYMIYLNNKIFNKNELESLKNERINFRNRVKAEYEKCIEKYIINEE